MRIVVLGAGVIGVTTAWYLRHAGHGVQVIDRREGPGLETSFANGGQISADHAAPWAKPGIPLQALKWMMQEDAPLLFRLRADPAQWRWGLQFLRNCTAQRFTENAARLQRLGRYSRAQLQALRKETGIQYDQAARGILVLYTGERRFEPGMKTPDECIALEPAIAPMKHRLVGGRVYPEDESGDAYKFTTALAKLCETKGVEFAFGVDIKGFSTQGEKITSVKTQTASIEADAYILALGSYSPLLARPLGIDLPIYPLKGYSVTMPVKDPAAAWSMSLSDEAHKLVLSRLGDRLRIAGTAELNGYDTGINEIRCQAILKRVQALFPGAGDPSKAQFWAGLRPATPTNLPCIGRTKYSNLFLNAGHGTLGWTHACGSGRYLADLVSGRRPGIEP
jgi:D-amino-acid dehydrogenase